MSKLKLTYFDFAASRGEECRLALHIAGVEFEDNRIPRKRWLELKPSTPFGSLPTLELEGKPAVSQSNAILGWIGRSYGLLPKDPWEGMRVESLLSACEDLRTAVIRTFGIKDEEELKLRRKELAEGPIQTFASNMSEQVRGPFVGGAELSVADVKIFVLMNWFTKGVLDHVPSNVLDAFPKLVTLQKSVAEHPKVVDWYATDR